MFFEIAINLKKEFIKFRMKSINRILSSIFFLSFFAVIIFNLSKDEFKEYYLFQKIYFFFIFIISFIGTFYIEEIKFNKKNSKIIFKKGLLFVYRQRIYNFEDLESIIVKKIIKKPAIITFDYSAKFIYMFGIKVKGKEYIIENRLEEAKLKEFINIVKSFFPKDIDVVYI